MNKKQIVGVVLVTLLSGCSMLPSTKKQSESLKSSEAISAKQAENFKRVVTGQKNEQPEIKVGGLGNKVEVYAQPKAVAPTPSVVVKDAEAKAPSVVAQVAPAVDSKPELYREETTYTSTSDQIAASNDDAKAKLEMTIPMGVKLILLGVGLLICIYAIAVARKSSASVNAAFQMADGVLSNRIRAMRDMALTSTEPSKIAELQTQIAALESDRGRMANQK
jgi:hypothetical protein